MVDTVDMEGKEAAACALWGLPPPPGSAEIVRAGSRYRPFRDGAGPSSPGTVRPEHRALSNLEPLGQQMVD